MPAHTSPRPSPPHRRRRRRRSRPPTSSSATRAVGPTPTSRSTNGSRASGGVKTVRTDDGWYEAGASRWRHPRARPAVRQERGCEVRCDVVRPAEHAPTAARAVQGHPPAVCEGARSGFARKPDLARRPDAGVRLARRTRRPREALGLPVGPHRDERRRLLDPRDAAVPVQDVRDVRGRAADDGRQGRRGTANAAAAGARDHRGLGARAARRPRDPRRPTARAADGRTGH